MLALGLVLERRAEWRGCWIRRAGRGSKLPGGGGWTVGVRGSVGV